MSTPFGQPSVLIPIAPGTNRNQELADAFVAAGATVGQVPLESLRRGDEKLLDHQLLALPGGFSYGDALGAGRLLGLDLMGWFADELAEARDRGMPIIGICNGFQALVRAGLLPGGEAAATLRANANGRFECRWVNLLPGAADSPWMDGITAPIRCPVAHGEGRFVAADLSAIEQADRVAFRYGTAAGERAELAYPANPNGSPGDVAGVVDDTGLVLGMMPHPEDHVFTRQDPHRRRHQPDASEAEVGNCLALFRAGVAAVTAG
jgi:phosphoribosylformylglycinamidine synthase